MWRLDHVRHRLPADVAHTVAASAADADRQGHLDDSVIAALAGEGLLAPAISLAHGGSGLSQTDLCLVTASLNTVCTSARTLVTVQSMVAAAIERAGSQEQKDRYLPPLASGERIAGFCLTGTGSGSDALDLSGAAVDRSVLPWRLSGSRLWVSFGCRADLLLVVAGPADNPVALLVDTRAHPDSVKRAERTSQLGLRGCEVADLEFLDHPVEQADVLADNRFTVGHVVQAALDSGRFTVAAGALGLAVGCLDAVTGHVRATGSRLAGHQLVQAHVADLLVHAETGLAACLRAAAARDEHAADAVYLTMVAKLVTTQAAAAAGAVAVQCLGSAGVAAGGLAERTYRDAKVLEIVEGTSEVTKLALARATLKVPS
jgi:acyl-CoA dehydrogenase